MNWLDVTALILVVIGALNWGLVGAFGFNLVSAIFGTGAIARIIYVIVGLAGLFTVWTAIKAGGEAKRVHRPARAL